MGELPSCGTYWMKLWGRVINGSSFMKRIKYFTGSVWFILGVYSIEYIFLLRQTNQKVCGEMHRKNFHVVFINSHKAYDCILGQLIWWILKKNASMKGS